MRTTDVTGEVTLPDGVEMVMPGDDVAVTVELISPVAMEDGMKFAIREGGRTVGAGVVSKIIQSASSSIGRAAVSKTAGWGFNSLLACQKEKRSF